MTTSIVEEFKKERDKFHISVKKGVLEIANKHVQISNINEVYVDLIEEAPKLKFDYKVKKFVKVRRIARVFLVFGLISLLGGILGLIGRYERLKKTNLIEDNVSAFDYYSSQIFSSETLFAVVLVIIPFLVIKFSRFLEKRRKVKGEKKEEEHAKKNEKKNKFGLFIVTSSGKSDVFTYYDYRFLKEIRDFIIDAINSNENNSSLTVNIDQSTNEAIIHESNYYGDIYIRNHYEGLNEEDIQKLFKEIKPNLDELYEYFYKENNEKLLAEMKELTQQLEKKDPDKSVFQKIKRHIAPGASEYMVGRFAETLESLIQMF